MVVVMETDLRERCIVAKKFGYSLRIKGWALTDDNVLVLNLPNVWDLVKHNGLRLAQVINLLPPGALVIAMWGSPCQDLTSYAEGQKAKSASSESDPY